MINFYEKYVKVNCCKTNKANKNLDPTVRESTRKSVGSENT